MGRSKFDAALEKRDAVKNAEADGLVADSMDVRKALMERVHAGEITLSQAQDELKRIKRNAKKNGLVTRHQAFSRG
ncbi:hypothetical protein DVP60_20930 [Yersinia enterocolitica]|uniref:hypothetical protein n=1 Tax=Yersinia enterocolitica TaxID=630 RepID=UPI0021E822CE|nr:hypothetical protein [Yersinia enterocolitica]EKN3949104.1 hypothetical protein [Yersinia enterocolitica]EKN6318680.1 hypothetical protein [Yersinia enterocolitica]UYJ99052.1 hypothetical protein N4W06_08380 [Yersinia enterocolitica]